MKISKNKIIVIAVIVIACLSASGGLYYMFKGSSDEEPRDGFGRRREWNDNNLPNPNKQQPQEIMAYMDSAEFKKVSSREQFMYMREGGQKVMDYQMETYFSLPDEQQKTAYLDSIIDRMQTQRASFEQMRQQMPPRRRDANEPNDPNRLARQERARQRQAGQLGGRGAPNPSRMRERSERGTALQRAQRAAFRQAMQARMQQRGITMPGPGGPRGGFGGSRSRP